jgi:hypothetical protein
MAVFCLHSVIDQPQAGGKWCGPSGQARHGPSIRYKITTCWVTLLQHVRLAAVLGQPSSLRPHWPSHRQEVENRSSLKDPKLCKCLCVSADGSWRVGVWLLVYPETCQFLKIGRLPDVLRPYSIPMAYSSSWELQPSAFLLNNTEIINLFSNGHFHYSN